MAPRGRVLAIDVVRGLFKEGCRGSVPLFQISALGILPAIFLTDGMLRCYARIPFILLMTMVKIIITLILIIPLVKIAGLTGAVVATTLVLYIGKGMMLWKTKTLMALPWRAFLPWRTLAGTLLLAVAVFIPAALLRQTLSISPFIALIFDTFFYWTAYTVLLFLTPLLPSSVRERAVAAADRMIEAIRGTKRKVKKEAW